MAMYIQHIILLYHVNKIWSNKCTIFVHTTVQYSFSEVNLGGRAQADGSPRALNTLALALPSSYDLLLGYETKFHAHTKQQVELLFLYGLLYNKLWWLW
jgi:hypothetical protein